MSSIKIIVMGVGGVGKSAITNRFVMGRWVGKYDPTIEESYQATIDVDGKALQAEILDTAGQDAYTALRETFMHTADGFLLVYSIVDDQTLEELRDIRDQILRVHPDIKVPMVVIGNKSDMESERAVLREEGRALAVDFGAEFLEVSAKENSKINEAFHTLVRQVLSKSTKWAKEVDPIKAVEEGASGVFGSDKLDASDEAPAEPTKSGRKDKKDKDKEKKADKTVSTDNKEKEKKGKCVLL